MKENIRHVLLRVETVTRDEEGKEEQISLQVPGIIGVRDGVPYIQYEESSLAGMEGVTTTITCREELVILERTGSVSQRQEYRRGETTQSAYETPMGTLNIEVTPRELLVNLNEGRGQLKLAYDISVKGLFNHFNTISIELREDPDFYGNQGKAETNH